MEPHEIILAGVGMFGALANIILFLILNRIGRSESRTEKVTERHQDTDRLVSALEALTRDRGDRAVKVEDRATAQGETLAGLSARIHRIEGDNIKCERLEAEIAVLKDWKASQERHADRLDQAVTDIAAMQRDIKTLFEKSKSLPGDVVSELERRFRLRSQAPAG